MFVVQALVLVLVILEVRLVVVVDVIVGLDVVGLDRRGRRPW